MSYFLKAKIEDDDYSDQWICHPDNIGDEDKHPIYRPENRAEIEVLGGVSDDDACYSYDDWALCKFRGEYFLFATAGCSCPSPSETWRTEIGPATLQEIRDHVTSGEYEGYTLPKRQEEDFLEMIDRAIARERN